MKLNGFSDFTDGQLINNALTPTSIKLNDMDVRSSEDDLLHSVLESETDQIRLPEGTLEQKLTIPKTHIHNEYQNFLQSDLI
jgi:hypothetical protein